MIDMGRCGKSLELDAEIPCIVTWLRPKSGYPTVYYYQFLANVMKTDFRDVITPFRQTSQIAARWLRRRGVRAEMIYINGSHKEGDVLADLVSSAAIASVSAPGQSSWEPPMPSWFAATTGEALRNTRPISEYARRLPSLYGTFLRNLRPCASPFREACGSTCE